MKDSRFPPLSVKELTDKLRCEISLLSDFEEISDPLGWEVGTHGIEVEFNGPKNSLHSKEVFTGTFLPNVAVEQGWD